jgi:hypothetical protein
MCKHYRSYVAVSRVKTLESVLLVETPRRYVNRTPVGEKIWEEATYGTLLCYL